MPFFFLPQKTKTGNVGIDETFRCRYSVAVRAHLGRSCGSQMAGWQAAIERGAWFVAVSLLSFTRAHSDLLPVLKPSLVSTLRPLPRPSRVPIRSIHGPRRTRRCTPIRKRLTSLSNFFLPCWTHPSNEVAFSLTRPPIRETGIPLCCRTRTGGGGV